MLPTISLVLSILILVLPILRFVLHEFDVTYPELEGLDGGRLVPAQAHCLA